MKKEPIIFIQDIIGSIEKIEKYTKGINKEKFFKEDKIQDAVMKRLEVIGEAVRNLPDDFRDEHPNIPWKQITGMRDVLIHDYFGINLERVWGTVKKDLPELKDKISKILEEIKS